MNFLGGAAMNWRMAAVLAFVLIVGYDHFAQARRIDAQAQQIAVLADQLRSRPQTISEADLKRLLGEFASGQKAEIDRHLSSFDERIRLVESRPGQTVIIREVGPPGPAGPAGSPGTPGQPGVPGQPGGARPDTPLVPASALQALRGGATERIVAVFWPGHLVSCPTPGLEVAEGVELLRDQDGRLLSGAVCVKSVSDEIRLRPPAPVELRLPYNLGVGAHIVVPTDLSRTLAYAGPSYQNWASWGGVYSVGAGFGNAGWTLSFDWTLPIR
jgi:hypothetical protein